MKDKFRKESLVLTMVLLMATVFVSFVVSSCTGASEQHDFKSFPDNSWARFNILEFNIPIAGREDAYDVYFYAWFTKEYEFDSLPLNMVMVTPSGEERIMEYKMGIKSSSGRFLDGSKMDSSKVSIPLKTMLSIRKKGILKISIENLNPRLTTKGIKGAGVMVKKSGK